MEQETFWTLLHNGPHWEFEIFLMILFDVVIGAILFPFIKKHWNHHVLSDKIHGFSDSKTITLTSEQIKSIEEALVYAKSIADKEKN